MQEKLAEKLKNAVKKRRPAVIGFDGFIDEVVHVVDKRMDPGHYARVRTIEDYAAMVRNGAGLSTSMEIVTVAKKLGGNGPNMSIGLKTMGLDSPISERLGPGRLIRSMNPLADGSRIIGVADPGRTDAVEFEDGRSSAASSYPEPYELGRCKRAAGLEELIRLVREAELLSFSNWSMIMRMSEIWEGLLTEVLPMWKTGWGKRCLSTCRPGKARRGRNPRRGPFDGALRGGGTQNGPLGLTKRSMRICGAIRQEDHRLPRISAGRAYTVCRGQIKIDCLVVHPVKKSGVVTGGNYYEVNGPFCAHPSSAQARGQFQRRICLWILCAASSLRFR